MALSVTRDARFAGLGGVGSLDANRVVLKATCEFALFFERCLLCEFDKWR